MTNVMGNPETLLEEGDKIGDSQKKRRLILMQCLSPLLFLSFSLFGIFARLGVQQAY